MRIHLSRGDEDVLPPVVVVIDKPGSPADKGHRDLGDPGRHGPLDEGAVVLVVIQVIVVVGEIRLRDVEPAVVVVVAEIHPHACLFGAVVGQRRSGQQADLLERPVAFVVVEETWTGVVRHVDIGPPVVVIVADGHSEAIVLAVHRQADLRRNVRERAVAVVAVETVRDSGEPARAAHNRDAPVVAIPVVPTLREHIDIGDRIVGDVEIQVSIPVIVEEGCARTPVAVDETGLRRSHR